MSNFTKGFETGIKGTGFDAGGLGQALGGSIGGIGTAVGGLAGNLIGNGMESQAGGIINTLGDIGGMIPGPWGAAIGGGLKLVGGLVNAAFGTKTDQAKLNAANEGTNALRSFTSTASSFDDVSGPQAVASVQDPYKGGWFAKKKAKKKNDALKAERAFAQDYADRSVTNNVSNIAGTQSDNILANFAAFGGPLGFGSGAIGYETANQYNLAKHAAAMGQGNSLVSIPNSFQGLETFAFGGELNTQGADFTNGMIYINSGGSHERNPYEGVPMGTDQNGTPNLVEEGETVFMDYVFSKRLSVPKAIREKYKLRGAKALSFAEASKKLAKESEERPNDPISQRGLEAAMADLAMEQEKLRSRKSQQQVNKFDTGGPFNSYGYVSGYNGGWYGTDGRYTQEYLDRVNALTAEQLQAQFDDQYSFYSDDANKGSDRWKAIDAFYKANPQYKKSGCKVTADDVARAKRLGQDNKPGYMHYLVNNATAPPPKPTAALNRYYLRTPKEGGGYELTEMEAPYSGVNAETGMTWAEANPNLVAAYNGAGTVRDAVDVDGVSTTYTDYYFDTKPAEAPAEKVDLTPAEYKHRWEGLRYAPDVGLGLATLTDAIGWTNKPDYSNADAVIDAGRAAMTPQQVEWNPLGDYIAYNPFDRNYYSNQLAASSGATRRNILNTSGGNRGQALAGLIATDYNTGIQLGNLARQAEEYNLAQRHQVGTFNRGTNQANSEGFLKAAMANQDADMKARGLGLEAQMKGYQMREAARLASDEAKAANLSGFIESLGAIGVDNAALNARDFALATGTFGPVNPGYEYILTGRRQKKKGSYGGKLNRGRKGLTC